MNKHNLSVLSYLAHATPNFEEKMGQYWVQYGDGDMYPYYLQDLYASSSVHNAIVKGTSDMIYGDGLTSDSKDEYVDQWLQVVKLIGDGTCLRRAAFDLKLYGQCYLNVIWSNDRSKPAEIHHIPAASVRAGISDSEDDPNIYYLHDDWTKASGQPTQPIPAFSTDDRTAASQILHIRTYSPMNYYYAVPDYIGSTNYIELDRDISEFHLNNIKNGLFPSMMLTFNNGIPTEDERDQMERAIYDKFSGASNAGKILINWNDTKDDAPSVEPFNLNDPHKMYDYLSEQVMQRILSGHRVTSPLLFGLRSEGGGFGSNAEEMRDAYDLYLNIAVKPFQDALIKGIRPIFSASNITLDFKFKMLVPARFLDPSEEEQKKNSFRQESPKVRAMCG